MPAITLDTLGALHQHGYELTAYCPNNHGSKLDLPRLIEALGADFNTIKGRAQLLSRLRCNVCGERGKDLILSYGDTPTPAAGHGRSG